MPFNSLLLGGVVPDRKMMENNAGIKIENIKDDETIILFNADKCTYFHETYLKQKKSSSDVPSCCDAVCVYSRKSEKKDKPPKLTITLIELKGGERDYASKATKQILATRNGILRGIADITGSSSVSIVWKAIVVSNSSVSKNAMPEAFGELTSVFKKNVYPLTANKGYVDIYRCISEIR